jgi:hypothetical protein
VKGTSLQYLYSHISMSLHFLKLNSKFYQENQNGTRQEAWGGYTPAGDFEHFVLRKVAIGLIMFTNYKAVTEKSVSVHFPHQIPSYRYRGGQDS